MTAIEIKNLSFSYDKQKVLENINLKVKQKDFLAIIGPNGGGKSTLLKLILGINHLQDGSIKIFDKNPNESLMNLGYVPQNTNINVNFPIKVIEVVLMGCVKTEENKQSSFLGKYFHIGHTKQEKLSALDSLKKVGMEKFAQNKIGSLSGGQRQRVMIARALCNHPNILLLDEPTANIDANGQKQIYELLKELNKKITIVVVSHDISVIMEYASKVAHINKTLTYHDISNKKSLKPNNKHFCEVELLEMLGSNAETHEGCKC